VRRAQSFQLVVEELLCLVQAAPAVRSSPQHHRGLVSPGLAERGVFGLVGRSASANICSTSASMASLMRFACIEASAAIFVPSTATRPTDAIPAVAHKRSEAMNSYFRACS